MGRKDHPLWGRSWATAKSRSLSVVVLVVRPGSWPRPPPDSTIGQSANSKPNESGAEDPRRRHESNGKLQDEDDEKVPERLADDTVVAIVKVPDIVAVLPDAVTLPLNETVPTPPATSLS